MKHFFLIVSLFMMTVVHALDEESTLKLYEKLLSVLVPQKTSIQVYISDPDYRDAFKKEGKVVLVERLADADFVLLTDYPTLERYRQFHKTHPEHSPVIFTTKYRLLKDCTDAVGALYWRKGRSQLLFIAPRLKLHDIVLPPAFKKFAIEAL